MCGCFNRFLFDTTPIGARVVVSVDAVQITARFGGIIDGVLLLTGARVFSNIGTPVDGVINVLRIPIRRINFFALL